MIHLQSVMKLYLLLIICGLTSPPLFSQISVQDSLLNIHLDNTLPDTTRMRALFKLGETPYRDDSLLYYHERFAEIIN